jgi:hypothetical protein
LIYVNDSNLFPCWANQADLGDTNTLIDARIANNYSFRFRAWLRERKEINQLSTWKPFEGG